MSTPPSPDGFPFLVWRDTRVDLRDGSVMRGQERHALSDRECEALAFLAQFAGSCVPLESLEREVWKLKEGVRSQTVPVTLRKIRAKLGDGILSRIRTEGWKLAPPDDTFGVPTFSTPFVSRPALEEAVQARFDSGWRIVGLVGPLGLGKTRLAAAMAHGWRTVFVNADDVPRRAVATALGCGMRVRDVQQALNRFDGFVILDGFDEHREALIALLENHRSSSGARLLLTLRAPLGLPGESVVEVGPFDSQTAQAFLRDRLDRLVSPERYPHLADQLHRNPLALELASRAIRADVTRIDDFATASWSLPEVEEVMQRQWDRLPPETQDLASVLAEEGPPLPSSVLVRWRGPGVLESVHRLQQESMLLGHSDGWSLEGLTATTVRRRPERLRGLSDWHAWLIRDLIELGEEIWTHPKSALAKLQSALDAYLAALRATEGATLLPAVWAALQCLQFAGPPQACSSVVEDFFTRYPDDPHARLFAAHERTDPALLPEERLAPEFEAWRFSLVAANWWLEPLPPAPEMDDAWSERDRILVESALMIRQAKSIGMPIKAVAAELLERSQPWPFLHIRALGWASSALGQIQLTPRAVDLANRGAHRAREVGLDFWATVCADSAATQLFALDPKAAMTIWKETAEYARNTGNARLAWNCKACIAACHCLLDAPHDALDSLIESVSMGPRLHELWWVAVELLRIGLVAEVEGVEPARQHLQSTIAKIEEPVGACMQQIVQQAKWHIDAVDGLSPVELPPPCAVISRAQQARIWSLQRRDQAAKDSKKS